MLKKIFIFIITLATAGQASAQFISNGRIEFEKQTNLKMTMNYELDEEQRSSEWFKMMLEKMPKYMTSYYQMDFDANHSVYHYVKDGDEKMPMMFGGKGPAKENIVKTNFVNNTFTAQKKIFETEFLVSDTSRKLQWRIEDEIRVIAGYPCRKAVSTICDSVVIVAFYTDQITVSGGPESINGLPGMILGLAVPRLYTTWFATKVELVEYQEPVLKEAKKTKTVTYKELESDLSKSLKDWGKYGFTTIWWSMI